MNWADWAIVAIVFASIIISLVRGFVREIFSLAIWIVALLLANLLSAKLDHLLEPLIATPSVRSMSAFVIIFVSVLMLGFLLNLWLGWMIKAVGLSFVDHVIGIGFGLVRGLFIVVVLIIYVPEYVAIKNDPWFNESKVIPSLKPFEARVKELTGEFSYWALGLMSGKDLMSDEKNFPTQNFLKEGK